MAANDSEIMNYLMRMVVPMRREFGEALNVRQFMHDQVYAEDVLKKALSSQDPGLRERAEYVSKLRYGPRVGAPQPEGGKSPQAGGQAGQSPVGVERRKKPRDGQAEKTSAPTAPSQGLSPEEEMRQNIMKKYTSGLR